MGAISNRLLRAGEIIVLEDGRQEVVRNVSVVLDLANGQTIVLDPREFTEVIPPEDVSKLVVDSESEPPPVGG